MTVFCSPNTIIFRRALAHFPPPLLLTKNISCGFQVASRGQCFRISNPCPRQSHPRGFPSSLKVTPIFQSRLITSRSSCSSRQTLPLALPVSVSATTTYPAGESETQDSSLTPRLRHPASASSTTSTTTKVFGACLQAALASGSLILRGRGPF